MVFSFFRGISCGEEDNAGRGRGFPEMNWIPRKKGKEWWQRRRKKKEKKMAGKKILCGGQIFFFFLFLLFFLLSDVNKGES